MCGIAGFAADSVSREERELVVGRMTGEMIHRGPDDGGLASIGPATLGMRRLAIFDPANGRQPMVTPDGRFTLVFNGAVYNYRELRSELTGRGHAFRTACDTEVLLAAFAEWGEKCLPRLRGMFAFAVWDRQEQFLFLARDPFGIKPLYFRNAGGTLLFASELNALVASGAVPAQVDPQALAESLAWFSVPAPRTIYEGVRSLRPGELAIWRDGQLQVRSYWDFGSIRTEAAPVVRSREEFIRELRGRLEDTIRAHILADVPVGAFLSGGLDSAIVVGMMTRLSGSRLKTFSIDFSEEGYSEGSPAAATAAHFGTEHTAVALSGADLARDLDGILSRLDQPTGDGINTYYASKAAHAGGVKVALSGLGGDELFGGYPSFRDIPQLARWLPRWRAVPRPLRSAAIRFLRRGDTRRRKLADILSYARTPSELASLQRQVFDTELKLSLLDPAVVIATGGGTPHHPALERMENQLSRVPLFELVSAWELRTYMADVLLRDSDVMSMRHSLELRVPFIDRPFVEWLWRQPAQFKADPAHPKSALAAATADLLPPGLRDRRKRGFTLPLALWMKKELRPFLDETFSESSVSRSGFFSHEPVQRLWRGFQSGADSREWSRLWSLAVTIDFVNRRAATGTRAKVESAPFISIGGNRESGGRTKRTLLMAPEIFGSEGGIPRILQLYLRALCQTADGERAVRLLALNDSQMDTRDLRRCCLDHELDGWTVCSRNKRRFVQAALRMSRGVDRIICGHVAQLPVAWMARQLNPRLRYCLVAHGIEVWRRFSMLETIALRGADQIFCVSDYTRRELLRNCPSAHGTVVVPNALDPVFEIRGGKPLPETAPVILTVTRLTYADRYKGVEDLIRALPEIRGAMPDAQLRLVGRGDDIPRLQRMAAEMKVTGAVHFLGYLDDTAMTAEYDNCRLFALPSRKEGFGLVYLEAMARGRPCLGARAGGVPEVITPESGVLVDYGDIAGIARMAVAALHRQWDQPAILDRARTFSFEAFQQRLARLLAGVPGAPVQG